MESALDPWGIFYQFEELFSMSQVPAPLALWLKSYGHFLALLSPSTMPCMLGSMGAWVHGLPTPHDLSIPPCSSCYAEHF